MQMNDNDWSLSKLEHIVFVRRWRSGASSALYIRGCTALLNAKDAHASSHTQLWMSNFHEYIYKQHTLQIASHFTFDRVNERDVNGERSPRNTITFRCELSSESAYVIFHRTHTEIESVFRAVCADAIVWCLSMSIGKPMSGTILT